MLQKILEYLRGDLGVVCAHGLHRVMTDAAVAAAYEQHADVGEARHHHGIVAGTARQAPSQYERG
jgi:hypothetical protein